MTELLTLKKFCRIVEEMAIDILRNVRATGEVNSQKETLKPDKDEIKAERKRGIAVG